jgi:hypothetical protein
VGLTPSETLAAIAKATALGNSVVEGQVTCEGLLEAVLKEVKDEGGPLSQGWQISTKGGVKISDTFTPLTPAVAALATHVAKNTPTVGVLVKFGSTSSHMDLLGLRGDGGTIVGVLQGDGHVEISMTKGGPPLLSFPSNAGHVYGLPACVGDNSFHAVFDHKENSQSDPRISIVFFDVKASPQRPHPPAPFLSPPMPPASAPSTPKVKFHPGGDGDSVADRFKGLSSGEDLEVVTHGPTGTEEFWSSMLQDFSKFEGSAFGPSFIREATAGMGDFEWGVSRNPAPEGLLSALGTGDWAGEVLQGTEALIQRLEGLSSFSAGTFITLASGTAQFTLQASPTNPSPNPFFTSTPEIGTTVFIPIEAASQIVSILASPEADKDGQWMVFMRVVR